jgi:hypothetical protein
MIIETITFISVLVGLFVIYFTIQFLSLRKTILKMAAKELIYEAKAMHPKSTHKQIQFINYHGGISNYDFYIGIIRRLMALSALQVVLLLILIF